MYNFYNKTTQKYVIQVLKQWIIRTEQYYRKLLHVIVDPFLFFLSEK
jgi:hypothetical protein